MKAKRKHLQSLFNIVFKKSKVIEITMKYTEVLIHTFHQTFYRSLKLAHKTTLEFNAEP